MNLIIKKCTISEIENSPNVMDILDEYASESAIAGLPKPNARVEMYKYLENIGSIYALAAFLGEKLIGYITVLSPVLPHYGTVVATAESFFVAKEHRKTGAGLKLLRQAEEYAKSIGSPGLLVSSPMGGNLAFVLPHVGYEETNRVFFRNFSND